MTIAFAGVALAAVMLTTWLTLGAVFSAQQELFGLQPSQHGDRRSFDLDPATRQAFGRIVRTAWVAALFAFLLASGTAAAVTRLLTRPLSALTDGARRLAEGERGIRLTLPSGRDELRSLTEAFNNLVTGLEAQEAWRRNLVADVAHDLRTPLAVLRSEIEAMQDGVVAFDDGALERLHHEVMMLTRLVGDLRTLSLAEGGGLALEYRTVAVGAFLERVRQAFETPAAEAGVSLVPVAVGADLGWRFDPERIQQVLANLIDNALRYAAPGEVEIGADARGETLLIWVRDHGPGLPADALERVFERFYRGDAARVRRERGGGSGLGLAIARAIVEAHGGRLEAQNHPDGGALFSLTLPADRHARSEGA